MQIPKAQSAAPITLSEFIVFLRLEAPHGKTGNIARPAERIIISGSET